MPVMPTDQTAPAQLELVREFVNTLDVEEDTDELDDRAAGPLGWLAAHGLAGGRASAIDEADRRAPGRGPRGAARAAARQQPRRGAAAGGARGRSTSSRRRRRSCLRFDADGAALVTRCGGVDSAIGRLLAIVHRSMGDRTWRAAQGLPGRRTAGGRSTTTRATAPAPGARWAKCGNRAKARRFRERQPIGRRRVASR